MLVILGIAGDGLCLFRSIVQLQHSELTGTFCDYTTETLEAEHLRDETARYIELHPAIVKNEYLATMMNEGWGTVIWENGGGHSTPSSLLPINNSGNVHVNAAQLKQFAKEHADELRDGEWARMPEVIAVAELLNRPVQVHDHGNFQGGAIRGILYGPHGRNAGPPLHVVNYSQIHFEALVDSRLLARALEQGFVDSSKIWDALGEKYQDAVLEGSKTIDDAKAHQIAERIRKRENAKKAKNVKKAVAKAAPKTASKAVAKTASKAVAKTASKAAPKKTASKAVAKKSKAVKSKKADVLSYAEYINLTGNKH
jgi:hypothetical protein